VRNAVRLGGRVKGVEVNGATQPKFRLHNSKRSINNERSG
jgi:hypothetical protein